MFDGEKDVLAVALGALERRPVEILGHLGKVRERREYRTAERSKCLRIIGAEQECTGLLRDREGVDADRERRDLACAATHAVESQGVGVVPRRHGGIEMADTRGIGAIRRSDVQAVHGVGGEVAVLQSSQNLLGGVAETVDTEVVDEFELTLVVHPGVQREFGVGRAALAQRAARVVGDPADNSRPDATRADDGVRSPIDGREFVFEFA